MNKIKHKAILLASKRLLLTNLTCWNVVEEVLDDLFESGVKQGIQKRTDLQRMPIYQYDSKGQYIDRFESIMEAAEILGITKQAICHNLKGRVKKCQGFIFKYANKQKHEEAQRRKVEN